MATLPNRVARCSSSSILSSPVPSLQLLRTLARPSCQPTKPIPPQQQQTRSASMRSKRIQEAKAKGGPVKRKKPARTHYRTNDLKQATLYPLVDAMHYLRAFEVGRPPRSTLYELAIKLETAKQGAVIRNRMKLPHAVKTDLRICVICPPDSDAARAAREAGATLVGEDDVFDRMKEGKLDFDRCICHQDSLAKLQKASLGRILGPKGLMPSVKTGTVVKDVVKTMEGMAGGTEYRERSGVIRIAVGQLRSSPQELRENVESFITTLKKDINALSDRADKKIHEVVLSSSQGPGFLLSGDFKGPDSINPAELTPLE